MVTGFGCSHQAVPALGDIQAHREAGRARVRRSGPLPDLGVTNARLGAILLWSGKKSDMPIVCPVHVRFSFFCLIAPFLRGCGFPPVWCGFLPPHWCFYLQKLIGELRLRAPLSGRLILSTQFL